MERTLHYTDKWGEKTDFHLDTDTCTVEIIHGLDRRGEDVETLESISAEALHRFSLFAVSTTRESSFMEEPDPMK